LSELLVGS